MNIYELKCKRMTTNVGGEKVEDKVVATNGKEWTIAEAARMVLYREAVFTYQSEKLTDLTLLPEC